MSALPRASLIILNDVFLIRRSSGLEPRAFYPSTPNKPIMNYKTYIYLNLDSLGQEEDTTVYLFYPPQCQRSLHCLKFGFTELQLRYCMPEST